MNADELKAVLEKHKKWLTGEEGGDRANLSEANLREANLSEADLSYAVAHRDQDGDVIEIIGPCESIPTNILRWPDANGEVQYMI